MPCGLHRVDLTTGECSFVALPPPWASPAWWPSAAEDPAEDAALLPVREERFASTSTVGRFDTMYIYVLSRDLVGRFDSVCE